MSDRSTGRRVGAVVRAAGAVVMLGAMLVGVPVALVVFVGNPLPSSLPDLQRAQIALRGGLPPPVLVNGLAVVVWLAWGQLAVAVAGEAAARVRGRASSVRGVPAGVQRVAARLVAAVVLAGASGRTGAAVLQAAPTVGGVVAAQQTATAAAAPSSDGSAGGPDGDTGDRQPVAGGRVQVVETDQGDTLWSLAEQHLGDGRRYRQIAEANAGRRVSPDTVFEADTKILEPGWRLVVPADRSSGGRQPSSSAEVDGQVVVEAGDHFWGLAEQQLVEAWGRQPTEAQIRAYWRRLVNANTDRLQPPDDPDVIYPGQQFTVPEPPPPPNGGGPAAAGRQEAGRSAPSPPTGDRQPTGQAGPADASHPTDDLDDAGGGADAGQRGVLPRPGRMAKRADTAEVGQNGRHPTATAGGAAEGRGWQTPAVVVGGSILAAGLVAAVDRMRRRQFRRRADGTRPPAPPAEARQLEAQLRAEADPHTAEFVDMALRHLGAGLAGRELPPPELVGVTVTDQALWVVLDEPDRQTPDGWTANGDATSWRLDRPADLSRLQTVGDAVHPLPALVTVGYTGDGTQVLVNLEHVAVMGVQADDPTAVMVRWAAELAVRDAAAGMRLVCVGFGERLASLGALEVVDDLDEVLDVVAADAGRVAEQVGDTGPLQTRLAHPGADVLVPTVVFDPSGQPDPELVDAATAAPRAGTVAVVGGPAQAGWQLSVDGDQVDIPQLAYGPFRFQPLDDDRRDDLAELLDTASSDDTDPAGRPLLAVPIDPVTDPDADADGPAGDPGGADPQVDVQVLGPVQIVGLEADGGPPAPEVCELVCYLALHPDGTDPYTLMGALWPRDGGSLDRLQAVVAEARRLLGTTPTGDRYLPVANTSDTIYRLHPTVGCDLHRFGRLVDAAEGAPDDEAAARRRRALLLVRGQPFADRYGRYRWTQGADGPAAAATVAVDDTARTLAGQYLAAGDYDGVRWATGKGLAANPGSEGLYRLRMRAAAADTGKPSELERVVEDLRDAVAAQAGPAGDRRLQPSTRELYQKLRAQLTGASQPPAVDEPAAANQSDTDEVHGEPPRADDSTQPSDTRPVDWDNVVNLDQARVD